MERFKSKMVPYYELTKEEEKILADVENGVYVPVKGKERARLMRMAVNAARATLDRTKNINIRLSERDLIKLKGKAAEQGLPYQTLVSSIIHQYNNKS